MRDELPPERAGGEMKQASSRVGRRGFARAVCLLPLASLSVGPRGAMARPADTPVLFEDGATILVAGSEHGRLDQWATLMAAALARGLPAGTAVRRQLAGGDDGVTGANQFEARTAPDGRTVLMLPGAAALAWLAGDPRARFDAARWVPVMAGWTPGVVVSRVPLGALPAGARLRIAAADPGGADLAALLGLELLRIEAQPVFRLDGFEARRSAVAAQAVDAMFLYGENVPRQAALLAASGVRPLFTLGLPDAAGGTVREPLFPDIPTLPELLGLAPGSAGASLLYTAWRAAAAAAQIDFALVLPQLTPAAMVALWRRAGVAATISAELQQAVAAGVRPVVAPAATTAALTPDAATMLELRKWLVDRYNWQPA